MDSSQESQASTKQQLLWLKSMTVRTGAIHEAQALQLKMYPMMLPGAKKGEARVGIDDKVVHYIVTCRPFKQDAVFKKTCAAIEKWTRWLLWDEARIMIKVNGKVVYESKS